MPPKCYSLSLNSVPAASTSSSTVGYSTFGRGPASLTSGKYDLLAFAIMIVAIVLFVLFAIYEIYRVRRQ